MIALTLGIVVVTAILFVRRLLATKEVVAGFHPEINLPYEESVELYHNSTSSCSQKVRTCLHEAGVKFKVDRIGNFVNDQNDVECLGCLALSDDVKLLV